MAQGHRGRRAPAPGALGRLRRLAGAARRSGALAGRPRRARRAHQRGDGERRGHRVAARVPDRGRRRSIPRRAAGHRGPGVGARAARGYGGPAGRARGRAAHLAARRPLAHQVPGAGPGRRPARPLLLHESGRPVRRRDGELSHHRRRHPGHRQRRDRDLDDAGPARRRPVGVAPGAVPLGRRRRARRVPLRHKFSSPGSTRSACSAGCSTGWASARSCSSAR